MASSEISAAAATNKALAPRISRARLIGSGWAALSLAIFSGWLGGQRHHPVSPRGRNAAGHPRPP
jgi:hypothetical protein